MCETWHSYPYLTTLTSSLLIQDTVPLTSTETSVLSKLQDRASPQCLPQCLSCYGDLHLPEHLLLWNKRQNDAKWTARFFVYVSINLF